MKKLTAIFLRMFKTMSSLAVLLISLLVTSTSTIVQACGRFEFYIWEDLPPSIQKAAEKLNYNEEKWNYVGTNPIERFALSDLMNGTVFITVIGDEGEEDDETIEIQIGEDEIKALQELDLYDDTLYDPYLCWDHFVNHYTGYSWDELTAPYLNPFGSDLSTSLNILGWTQEMWDSTSPTGDIPASDCKDWFDLTPDELWAAQTMGWTGMKWMNYPLGK